MWYCSTSDFKIFVYDKYKNAYFVFSAENIAKQYVLNQSTQDAFAFESQMKYKAAQEAGNHK